MNCKTTPSNPKYLTASKLQDYLVCPHRVWRDEFGPMGEKEKKVNPFVELLWEKGVWREREVIKNISSDQYLDLNTNETLKRRFEKTLQAMGAGAPLIYQGVLHFENMIGIPDLLQKTSKGNYVPIDIKSARGYKQAGTNTQKLKERYVVQLCMYVELLQKLGLTRQTHGYIYDSDNKLVLYEGGRLISRRNRKTCRQFYLETKQAVWELMNGWASNRPALTGDCALCPWSKSCLRWCKESSDLTNIFYLGRSKRKVLNQDLGITTVKDAGQIDVEKEIKRRCLHSDYLYGMGRKTLTAIKRRGGVLTRGNGPLVYRKYSLPTAKYELFFDIEDDPTQSFVYLHGFWERGPGGSRFVCFTAKESGQQSEKDAFKKAINYILSFPQEDISLYYYSGHEKTMYRKLQEMYPDVVSKEEIEKLFGRKNSIDLYSDIIYKSVDWPLSSYSLKEIASYLGFKWRDESPSGAESIIWYHEYLRSKDEKVLQRILDYNEDDCKATMVIKMALE
ncbi:MAG: TM0106 family RecB-like putative nuclease [bacterium]